MDDRQQIPWSITARNLPEHARNPIHTDEGAQAAGFERALVAGVTSYAYCCHPVIDRFGLEWVGSGEAEVRFRAPVFDGDVLSMTVSDREDGGIDVAAMVERSARPLVEVSAWRSHRSHDHPRPGEVLEPVAITLVSEYGPDYARRAGDVLDGLPHDVAHPVLWLVAANFVFHHQLVRGSWVHTRSIVRHHACAHGGDDAEVSSVVIRRFQRGGERAVADVTIAVAGETVATVEHEAIIDLAPQAPQPETA